MPLYNNGKVESADILKMPEEATYVSRDTCYDLPPVHYTSIGIDFIRATSELAAEAGGEIPAKDIVKIEAEVKGKLRETDTILIRCLKRHPRATRLYKPLRRFQSARSSMIF
jgi:hypothetical protein